MFNKLQQLEFIINDKWGKNGIAIWDNGVTQYCALVDYWSHRWGAQRVTVKQPE